MQYFLLILLTCCSLFAEPKAIVFDFGGVIGDNDRKPMVDYLSTSLNIPRKKIKKDFTRDQLYARLNEPVSYWSKYAERPLSDQWYEGFLEAKSRILQPVPGMKELVIQLKAKNKYQISILSNTSKIRSSFIRKQGVYEPFDPVLLSCDLAVKKPKAKIYKILLMALKMPASDVLFVDNKKSNIDAGKKLGIDGIVFESTPQLRVELAKRGVKF